jgi:hypothetical protein
VVYFSNFHATAQSKQSPIGRKFARSGHPGHTFICTRQHNEKTQQVDEDEWKGLKPRPMYVHDMYVHTYMTIAFLQISRGLEIMDVSLPSSGNGGIH